MPLASLLYFLLGVLLFLATLAALSPGLYGPFRALAGFTGMALTLALPQIVLLGLGFTALAWSFEAFAHPLGELGLLLHLGSWTALAILQWRMNRALPLLDGQVVEDQAPVFDRPASKTPFAPSLLPALLLRTKVLSRARIDRSVVFHQAKKRKLVLDVYRPPEGAGTHPAIVYIHGGGWVVGSRRQSRFMCAELAARGFPVFAISYRFAPFAGAREMISDCKAALAWVRREQQKYGADERTLVMGGSAGGHLAAMLALSANEPRFQPGFEDADTSVHGAVVLYGVTDLTGAFTERKDFLFGLYLRSMLVRSPFSTHPEAWREVEPLSWASPKAPPILFVHGLSDGVVPVAHSKRLMERLREAGSEKVHLLELPLAHHAFEVMPTIQHQRAVRVISAFCEKIDTESVVGDAL